MGLSIDSFFVPLMGSLDNSTPPWIGGPWSPEVSDDKSIQEPGAQGSPLSHGWKQKNSPSDVPVTVRAYAGPMSPSKVTSHGETPKGHHLLSFLKKRWIGVSVTFKVGSLTTKSNGGIFRSFCGRSPVTKT